MTKIVFNKEIRVFSVTESIDKYLICENILNSLIQGGINDSTSDLPDMYFDIKYADDVSPLESYGVRTYNVITFPLQLSETSKNSILKKYLEPEDIKLVNDAYKVLVNLGKKYNPNKIINNGKLVFDIDRDRGEFDVDDEAFDEYSYKKAYVINEGVNRISCVILKDNSKFVLIPTKLIVNELVNTLKFPSHSLFEVTGVDFIHFCNKMGYKDKLNDIRNKYQKLK